MSAKGAQKLGQIASVLAHGEGLTAHARAAEMRLNEEEAKLSEDDLSRLAALRGSSAQ